MADVPGEVELDDAQLRVVEADADERLVVIAGAGQGKTEVVASRLVHLIESEGLSASSELLVLSFSRAAVHAVRARVASHDTAEANVRTFDSFASQLLLDEEIEPVGSFEHRIRQATELLRETDEAPDLIADLSHVVIDEVQDLVGDRAVFVLAILDHLSDDAGITVLGDPLQGIYGFVLDQSKSRMSFDTLYRRLLDEYRADKVSLQQNYRARGSDPLKVVDLASILRADDDSDNALRRINVFEYALPKMEAVTDWNFVDLYDGRTAVLCRSNAEVLRVSRAMAEQGIRHSIRRHAQEFGAMRWISPALASLAGPIVAREDVENAIEDSQLVSDTEDGWYLLKSTAHTRESGQLNLARLRARIRSRSIPLPLTQGDDSAIIVSTVHRAKGLEFENVFVVDSGYEHDDEDRWAVVRRKYVALSRARDNIIMVEPKRSWGSSIKEYGWLPNRLQERVGKKGHTRARSIEFGPDDIYASRPAVAAAASAVDIQRTLTDVETGWPVEGTLDLELSDFDRPIYLLAQAGRVIGRTGDEFGEAFAKAFKCKPGTWPAELADLLLVSVETTGGDERFTEEAGLGPSGLWLVPRLAGLARPVWDVMEEV